MEKAKFLLKTIFLIAITLIIFQLKPQQTLAAIWGDYEYTVVDGNATITKYNGVEANVVIPKTINNGVFDYDVTSIGDSVFYNNYKIRTLIIGDSISSIGDSTFYGCNFLQSVTIPSSVRTIGNSAFARCSNLANLTLTNGLTNIGDNAFFSCYKLTNVTIPSTVDRIGDSAFEGCYMLTSINIPSSVTNIGMFAFRGWGKLAAIEVDPLNKYYSSKDGVLFDKSVSRIIAYPSEKYGNYVIPDSVTTIEDSAFYECNFLMNLTIPNSVIIIKDRAFYGIGGLSNIIIPKSVTSIGIDVFSRGANLKSIEVDPANLYYSSADGILFNKAKSEIIAYPGGKADSSYTIPDNIVNIMDYAFHDVFHLKSITIPNSIKKISNNAFNHCYNLESIMIPDSVTAIGDGAFYDCTNLISVTIPNSVTSIGDSAFKFCVGLSSLTIPASVTSIGDFAFNGCSKVTEVQFLGNAPRFNFNILNYDSNMKIFYLCGKTGFTNPWYGYKTTQIGIEVTTLPVKIDYVVGESLELSGIEITGYYKDGTTEVIPASMASISGFNSSTPTLGQVMTVKINDKIATFKVNIHAKTYTISFNSSGGQAVGSQSVNYNGNALKPKDPIRSGYTFGGWYKERNLVNLFKFTSTPITSNIVLYAKWIPGTPMLLTATSLGYDTIKISWNAASGANGYEIYKSTSSTGLYTILSTTETTSFVNTRLITGSVYYYKVRSYTIVGTVKVYSSFSNIIGTKPAPSVPTEAKAVSSSYKSANVTWGTVLGASGYEVWRLTLSSGSYTLIRTTATTSYTDNGLMTNSVYYYKIRAYRMVGTVKVYSDYSYIVSIRPIPSTPITVKAVSSSYESINVSWGAVLGASGYEVWRSISSAGPYVLVTSSTSYSFKNTALKTGTTYFYKIRAFSTVGATKVYGNFSVVISAKPIPSAPFVIASSNSYNSICTGWSIVAGASGYEVWRATSSEGTYTLIATTTAKSYINISLATGATYYYKVRPYTLVGTTKVYGNFSAASSAKPVPGITYVIATATSRNSIKTTWGTVPGASGYELWRSTSSTGTYSLVTTTTGTSYTNSSLAAGTTYYYKVRAYRVVGTTKVYGNWGLVASARTLI